MPCVSNYISLDAVDHRILELLQADARRTIADIAQHVNLSPAPVKRRLDRLERSGAIAGYTVVLDQARLGPAMEAFAEIRIAGEADVDELVAAVKRLPEVREILTTAGDPDALVRVSVTDVNHLKQVVGDLRRIPHVQGTKSMIVLGRWTRATDALKGLA